MRVRAKPKFADKNCMNTQTFLNFGPNGHFVLYLWWQLIQRRICTCTDGLSFGGVTTTPDPNTSAKASRYKWEAYRDTNWWCILYTTFCQEEGIFLQKFRDRNGRCVAIQAFCKKNIIKSSLSFLSLFVWISLVYFKLRRADTQTPTRQRFQYALRPSRP